MQTGVEDSRQSCDSIVVGSGPAGLTLARRYDDLTMASRTLIVESGPRANMEGNAQPLFMMTPAETSDRTITLCIASASTAVLPAYGRATAPCWKSAPFHERSRIFGGQPSSDAGVLALRKAEQRLGLCRVMSSALHGSMTDPGRACPRLDRRALWQESPPGPARGRRGIDPHLRQALRVPKRRISAPGGAVADAVRCSSPHAGAPARGKGPFERIEDGLGVSAAGREEEAVANSFRDARVGSAPPLHPRTALFDP